MTDRDEEQLVAAMTEIDRLRAEVSRLAEENRAFLAAMRHMTSASEEVLAEARLEAAETRARAAAEAYERLVVARADSRAAVHEQRQRAAAELELLAAVRERVTEERAVLVQFHGQLNGHLRQLVGAMLDFTDRTPVVDPPERVTLISDLELPHLPTALTEGMEERPALDVGGHTLTDMPAISVDPTAEADEELEQAFAEFFGAGDNEPSRSWILND